MKIQIARNWNCLCIFDSVSVSDRGNWNSGVIFMAFAGKSSCQKSTVASSSLFFSGNHLPLLARNSKKRKLKHWWYRKADFSQTFLPCYMNKQAYFLDAFPTIQLNWSWRFFEFWGGGILSLKICEFSRGSIEVKSFLEILLDFFPDLAWVLSFSGLEFFSECPKNKPAIKTQDNTRNQSV